MLSRDGFVTKAIRATRGRTYNTMRVRPYRSTSFVSKGVTNRHMLAQLMDDRRPRNTKTREQAMGGATAIADQSDQDVF
ncbi:hypothetical protein K227x_22740 [Rubripirellula lacrimiformis]|uniref:Uncharacterized protein n=1 Tax=Rubripirellula lacrimiformis TaxID=1930273 RepID=A0A517N9S7_9BACT|nr:hypothetical protein K227x_22740 [Rubripirellula lacrimiformis]